MSGDGIPGSQPTTAGASASPTFPRPAGGIRPLLKFIDLPAPVESLPDPETARRAKLISRFGALGTFFGTVCATFYLLIGHTSDAFIIIVCSSCFAAAPFLIRGKHSVEPTGHLLILVLTLGFTALCFSAGGFQEHAIAWLVSVPLCALLLLGPKAATRWAFITLFAACGVLALGLEGIKLHATYDMRWVPVVSAAGYLGLLVVIFVIGLVFETSRARAFSKMQEAMAELAKSNERLVHLNNLKNEFMGIAAHDLKNPLTIITCNAELAVTMDDRPAVNEHLGNIAGAAGRMRDLIADLLDYNAVEQGRLGSHLEPCDLHALVMQSVKNHQPVAMKKMIEIRADTAAGLWAPADSAAILQILDNLISNSLKFSLPGTTVHVQALAEANSVLMAVRDEGPGINEADQKKLFQKYSRLTPQPTGGESSTGLGLAIVKRLAEAMSGTVQCVSAPGTGSAFTVRLPACSPDGPTAGR